MNENEKKLFYNVLKEKITEEPASELASNIMHIIHRKVYRRAVTNKILEISGYILSGIIITGFLYVYLFLYYDFKLPSFNIGIETPSRIYIIIMSVIFVFALIELYFRKRLYEKSY